MVDAFHRRCPLCFPLPGRWLTGRATREVGCAAALVFLCQQLSCPPHKMESSSYKHQEEHRSSTATGELQLGLACSAAE